MYKSALVPILLSCSFLSYDFVGFIVFFFFFQAEDGIRDGTVTGVQTCALPISAPSPARSPAAPRPRPATTPPRPRHPRKIGRARVGKECRSRWSPYH